MNTFSEVETESDRAFTAMVLEMCGERRDASIWLLQCIELATHWDHVHDGDPVDKKRLGATLGAILTHWPRNKFYVENAALLAPVLLNAILAWESSDTDPAFRIKAYDIGMELPCAVAWCLGGEALARQWSSNFRTWAWQRCRDNDRKVTKCQP